MLRVALLVRVYFIVINVDIIIAIKMIALVNNPINVDVVHFFVDLVGQHMDIVGATEAGVDMKGVIIV